MRRAAYPSRVPVWVKLNQMSAMRRKEAVIRLNLVMGGIGCLSTGGVILLHNREKGSFERTKKNKDLSEGFLKGDFFRVLKLGEYRKYFTK